MFTFNGKPASELIDVVSDIRRRILPPMENHLVSIPGSDGVYDYGFDYGELLIEIDMMLVGDNPTELRSRVRDLADWLGQKETKELVFEDEPNMTYFARLSDSTELEEIIYTGRGTLTFLCPKPFAYGPEKDQLIAGIEKQHDTKTQEGWAAGTLTGVVATPDGLVLEKEGEDVSGQVDEWNEGTHDQTEDNGSGVLVLAKSGEDLTFEYGKAAQQIPEWEFVSRFEQGSVGDSGEWYVRSQSGGTYTLDGEKIIFEADTNEENIYIRRDSDALNGSPVTIDFRARISKETGARPFISVNDAETGGIDVELPDTDDSVSWFRLVYRGGTDFTLYQDGTEITPESVNEYGATSTAYINIGLDNGPCTFEAWKLAHANMDHGAPPANHEYTDEIIGEAQDLTQVGILSASSIDYNSDATNAYDYSTAIYSGLSTDGGDNWTETELSGGGETIPGLSKGDDVSGTLWRFRWTVSSRDSIDPVALSYVSASFQSGYHPSGQWVSPMIDLSGVGRAGSSSFSWENNSLPSGTTVTPFVRFSSDGGQTWGDWTEVTENGGAIPEIALGDDLSNVYFQYRMDLATDDIELTPEVDRVDAAIQSAYVDRGERVSDPINFGDFGVVGSSYISWDTTPDASPDVEVYGQVVNEGEQPDPGGWVQATNTGELPGAEVGKDMTGKAVYTRQVLKTSDLSVSPTLHRELWRVEPASKNVVEYAGTERAYPIMTVVFKDYADHFEISDPNTGNRVYVVYDFKPGDVLVIDNTKGSVFINEVLALDRVPLGAEQWIYFQKGENPLNIDPVGSAEVHGRWREVFK